MRSLSFSTTALLVSGLWLASGRANAQTVTTFAGSGAAGSEDGNGPQASFSRPVALAVDASGNLYVADQSNNKIRKITPSGTVTTFAGSGSKGGADGSGASASFRVPNAVAVDLSGNVYVTEESFWAYGSGSDADIRRITPTGDVTTAVTLHQEVMTISGVATDRSGNLYVADAGDGADGGQGKILKITPAGAVTAIAGYETRVEASNPWGIAVDPVGRIYFSDTNPDFPNVATGLVKAIDVDGSSRVLAAGLNVPAGIALDSAGGVFVAESGNNRILRVAADGSVSVVAGSGMIGSADGPAADATFDEPQGVAPDGKGNLYVSDSANNRIRKIILTGAACGPYCTNWFVPSVAHIAGADGSFWTSDLVLHNRAGSPAQVTLKFLGNSRDGTSGPEKSFTLDPLQTVTYADLLSSVFGIADDAGAVEILTPSDELTVRSRTFTAAAGGTVGDGLPGVRQSTFFTDQTSPSPVMIGLREDDRFRSNIILVNGTAASLDVLVSAFDSSGATIGIKSYTLPPLGMTQDSRFLTRTEFGSQPRSDVTVTLSSTTPGAAFTACAIVIDNASNAPTTVLPQ